MTRLIVAAVLWIGATGGAAAEELSVRETRKLVDNYARCIVANRPAKAAEVLVRNLDNQTLLRDYTRLVQADCLFLTRAGNVAVRFPGDSYRYALADALVRRELATVAAPDLTNVPVLDQRPLPEAPQPLPPSAGWRERKKHEAVVAGFADAVAYDFAARYGECVVRADPAAAKALLLSEPSSAEEASAFVSLAPALQNCLRSGRKQHFTKLVLRGALAVAYYRLAAAAGVIPSPQP